MRFGCATQRDVTGFSHADGKMKERFLTVMFFSNLRSVMFQNLPAVFRFGAEAPAATAVQI